MIPVQEAYPGRFTPAGRTCGIGDYRPLLESMGYDIVADEEVGDYQGDTLVVFRDGSRFGFLVFGWGSCSHCDALQSCGTVAEVEELRTELDRGIIWHESAAELARFMRERDWESQHYWCRDTGDFVRKAVALLEAL
jgi:hypothetical protein